MARSEQERPATVDVTLIDEMLALTPEQRLRHNDRVIRTIQAMRGSAHPKDLLALPILEETLRRCG